MDLIKDGLLRATMRLAGEVSMFCDFASATRMRRDNQDENGATIRMRMRRRGG